MKRSRYLLKRTKFAISTSFLPIILGLTLLAMSVALLLFNIWANNLSIDESLLPMAKNLPVFYDTFGNEMDYETNGYLAPDNVPENLKNAFVSLEDKRFYNHDGYDLYRIVGAVVKNIKNGGAVEGASTITQQLIKNTHLTFEKTVSRKLKEIALATQIEKMFSKDELLSMYLSVIYFGGGAYGVNSASKLYFDKKVTDLTLSECATLAGIIKNPTKYSPTKHPENCIQRRNLVLDIMFNQGFITQSQVENAKNSPLNLAVYKKENMAKFFLDMAVNEVCESLGLTKHQLDNSGLKIHTTYNPNIQKILVENSNLTTNFSKSNTDNSSVVLDNQSGHILAYHSSLGYEISRQLGSTIKPLVVYAPALENDVLTLATPMPDEQVAYGDWMPKNFGDKYQGVVSVREAIKQSSNTVAVKVASYVGERNMIDFGKRFGLNLTENDCNLTTALGATQFGHNPVTLSSAYSVFANEGTYQKATFLKTIIRDDRIIFKKTENRNQVISKNTAFLINDCLVDTVKDGTAKTLSALPFQVASKTGTCGENEYRDAWNVSYNHKYTIAVWHGDTNETGGGHPTRHAYNIWKDLYDIRQNDTDFGKFKSPDSIVKLPVDTYSTKENGQVTLSSSFTPRKYVYDEYFKASNALFFGKSHFESCPTNLDFDIDINQNGQVNISFETAEIYHYELTVEDVLGKRTIYFEKGNNNVQTVQHRPLSIGNIVTYTLYAYVENDGVKHLAGELTKSIIIP